MTLQGELDSVLNEFDKEIDAASVHQGKQMYVQWSYRHPFQAVLVWRTITLHLLLTYNCSIDKLTGALYLGELVRRVLSQLVLDRMLFDGHPCEKLDEADTFPTKYISEILA